MRGRSLPSWLALAALGLATVGARAADDGKYPDFKGQWERVSSTRWDPGKTNKAAPLTPEYRAIYDANVADMEAGGQGDDPTYRCMAPGMPRDMIAYEPMEVVVTPDTTYILIDHIHDNRRIHTDGRGFPPEMADNPQFSGYSIGRWADEDGDGRYDTLFVETRGMKGPRTYEMTGIPLHKDNQTIVKERIYLDKTDPDILHDDITTMDHALTRPWTVMKNMRRDRKLQWLEEDCGENNQHVVIGKDNYLMSADGYLMPARKDQAAPDLRNFASPRN